MIKKSRLKASEYKKFKEITDENGHVELQDYLDMMKDDIQEFEQKTERREKMGIRELFISLSINGGEADEFSFCMFDEKAEKLEPLYRECSQKKDFDNAKFWHWLQENEPELAHDVLSAIQEELVGSYIFSDDGFHYDLDVMRPDDCFPLRDLHFDYLTDEGDITHRFGDCSKATIYDDNTYDCDFSCTFDD